jgi:hypothetical protein
VNSRNQARARLARKAIDAQQMLRDLRGRAGAIGIKIHKKPGDNYTMMCDDGTALNGGAPLSLDMLAVAIEDCVAITLDEPGLGLCIEDLKRTVANYNRLADHPAVVHIFEQIDALNP